MSHKPIEPAYRAMMNTVAETLDEAFNGSDPSAPKNIGFMLLLWDGSNAPEAGRMNYISNVGQGGRAEVVTMLRTMLADAEGRLADTPKEAQ